jgi:hypothetical protein
MPLPEPKKNESKEKFIKRCAGSDVMNKEFSDNDQRLAVCYSRWESKGENINLGSLIKHLLND